MLDKLGLVCISIVGFQLLRFFFRFVYNHVIGPNFGLSSVDLRNMGKWAVITGSTDGIGKAYAEMVAKKGMSVVLISRNQSKLDDVCKDLETKYKVETKSIAVDFSQTDIYYEIEKQIHGMDIGLLVNNVGMSYSYPEYFLNVPEKEKIFPSIININIYSVTNMTNIVLPGMLERRRGVIINVSSLAATIPSPFVTVYSATKAYVNKFTEDLATEYGKFGIIFQCVLPGYVVTKMSKIPTSTWMAPSPTKYVKSALRTLGVQGKTNGYFPHTLMRQAVHVMEYLSPRLTTFMISRVMLNIRGRALRKMNNNVLREPTITTIKSN